MKFAKLTENAKAPTRKHYSDAGLDVYSNQAIVIPAHEVGIVSTGITIKVPAGYVCQVWPKSRSDYLVAAGIIDFGYTGEVFIKIANVSNYPLGIGEGHAIAQLVLVPVYTPDVEEYSSSDELHFEKTVRGSSGGIATQAAMLEDISDEELEEWLQPDLT